jgi:hypothetical protein
MWNCLAYFNKCVIGNFEYFDTILIFRPGIQDPTYIPPSVSEDLLRGFDSRVANSIAVVSHVAGWSAVSPVPLFDTFLNVESFQKEWIVVIIPSSLLLLSQEDPKYLHTFYISI